MNEFPIGIYFYPKYTGSNPYIGLLGEAIKSANPQARVFYDELDRFRFYPQPKWSARKSIVHMQFIPEFFHLHHEWSFMSKHIRRNIPYLLVIKQFLFLEKLKRQYGLKFIWTVHNTNSGHMRPTWTSFFTEWAYRLADAFMVHCKKSAEDSEIAETQKPIFVVPHANFIECHGKIVEDRIEAKVSMGIPVNVPVFLVFGKMHSSKNLKYIFTRLTSIPQQNLLFVIAGQPIGKQIYSLIKEYSKDKRFLFLSRHIPDSHIRWLMGAADFLINAQTRGYVSGVTVMALSYGLPVISIKWGCAPTLVKDGINGFLFSQEPGGLENAIERAIKTLCNQPAYKQMKLMAHESIKPYSWDLAAKKTLEAYYEILNR